MITLRHNSIARAASAAPAAPAGGGPIAGCRGCGFTLTAAAFLTTFGCLPSASAQPLKLANAPADQLTVPSAQPVYLHEVLADEAPGDLWLRFRFVAPDLPAGAQAAAGADMAHLCASVALPYLTDHALHPARIAISLADRAVPFGEIAPEATQYFELFSSANATCIWEAF